MERNVVLQEVTNSLRLMLGIGNFLWTINFRRKTMADISGALAAITQSSQDSVALMNAQTQGQAQVTNASIINQSERTVLEMANGAVAGMKSLTQALVQNISR